MGDEEGGLRTLEACLSSQVLELPLFRIPALRNLGVAHKHLGAFAAAETAFAEALEHARAMPWPFAEATIHFEWGLLERARGREDAAVRRLQEALTLFRSLGAEPYARLVKESLSA
jgi:tetratricopeptide (TPR) repeat protein